MPRRPPSLLEIAFIEYLYWNERKSQIAIAKMLDRSQPSVSSIMALYGISSEINRRREQRGAHNHNYKDGLSRSTVRRITKRLIEATDRPLNKCERCNETFNIGLNRHHRDRDRSNNAIANIELLCTSCHMREHSDSRIRDSRGRYT